MSEIVAAEPIPFIDLAKQQQRLRPNIDRAIAKVLDHGKYIMGPEVAELEAKLSAYTGAKHVIGCASGTDAILMALMAYDIGPGDAVFVPSFTFPATPEVVALLGATPIFIDVDRLTFNVDTNGLEEAVALATKHGLKPRGVLAVDLYGLPASYRTLHPLAEALGLWVIGDAAQSFGASEGGKMVGTLTELTATSFFPAKPLGCYGDGGCVFTDNDRLAEKLQSIRVHGKGQNKYDNVRIGLNARLDTLQAAILLEKLTLYQDEFSARQKIAEHYHALLADVNVLPPAIPDGYCSAWAQYTIILPQGCLRDKVQQIMKEMGVPTMVYYPKPLHQQIAYRNYPCLSQLKQSESLCHQVLSLPMHPYLMPEDQARVVSALSHALKQR